MIITRKAWDKYIGILRRLNNKAAEEMTDYMISLRQKGVEGNEGARSLVDYAYAVASKYGEGSAAAACQMYEAIAELSGAKVLPAIPAETASYSEVSRTVYGTIGKKETVMPAAIARLVKRAGADTIIKNAIRDKAEIAWIPSGDSCSFCREMAALGWIRASKDVMNGGHANHLHNNCNCNYAVRFNDSTEVAGYDPEKYSENEQDEE